ncbi:Ig-like domain-containing protein [Pseudemcibacter aquimaris]|uniref:Ig-like domain-containing protein n=1 Tax=Pseudemcibacter aquimaris TaxID=2857064 RepID=UPI002012A57C|nr:Ig-like domain-containing protein [Pseudemcibacter aquimaris]MCC3862316.1 Ig-like domain-containing protein [Pseudemcibacter aquimaris]WDU59064.1 tandem-95 repeat protein [Pseudemcibacter aquimaris]
MRAPNKDNKLKSKLSKKSSILMTVLPLAACGGGGTAGGGGGGGNNTPAPAPTLPAEFIEDPANVFIARDNRNTTLDQKVATADLTVTGKGGNDVINTGAGADTIDGASGNDLIRSGAGADTVNGGNGNDAIVLIGTTTAGQYDNGDITNAGNGYNLSSLISLDDINDNAVSDVEPGDVINGGPGTDTLFIYGTVDLTGVTISNVTILEVHSVVTLTPEQLAQFITVDGDGNSVINIEVPDGDTYILDLSVIDMSDIGEINIDGDLTVKVSDEDDFGGITEITSTDGSTVKLEVIDGGTDTSIDLDVIADTFDKIDEIILDDQVTLTVTNPATVTDVALGDISGTGTIETDGSSAVDTALDGVTIDPAVNGVPYANDDIDKSGENETILVDVLANDSDIDNDTLSLQSVSVPSGMGSVSIVDGKVQFNPGSDFDDLDDTETRDVTVTYTVTDGSDTDEGTLTITVHGDNDAPTAQNDTGNTFENDSKSFDVLANDSDIENDTLSITAASVDNAGQGSVSIVDGKVLFNPGTDFDDLATGATEDVDISYTVSDGDDTTDGKLTITVTGVNDPSIAVDDTADADENEIILIDALANDIDEENDDLSFFDAYLVDPEGGGSIEIVDNKIKFDPGTDFDYLATGATKEIIINYALSDESEVNLGSVTVTVTGVNDGPNTVDDFDEILNTETTTVDVLANDEDEENDVLVINNVSGPDGKGIASIVDGKIHFDPGSDFDGLAPGEKEDVVLDYVIFDGQKTASGALTITVVGPNEAPETTNDTATAGENETILVDVLANDTDADGHDLSISDVSVDEGKGSVSVVDGKIEFNPGSDFDYLKDGESVDVDITYSADDGIDQTEGTLTITVNGVNDDPITVADEGEVREGNTVYIDVLSNDSDPEGGELTLVSAETDKGIVTVEYGRIKYTAADDTTIGVGETGTATITYVVSGLNGISEGTVTVTINGTNDNPETTNDTDDLFEGSSKLIDVLSNDNDPNGDNLSLYDVSVVGGRGQVSISGDKINFDTAGDFNSLNFGQSINVTVKYVTIDGYGGYAEGTLTVRVDGLNDDEVITINNFTETSSNLFEVTTDAAATYNNVYSYSNTIVLGWTYSDNIIMGSGDDIVIGYDGADILDGGFGQDLISYFYSDAAVNVNLTTGTGSGGTAAGDRLSNFEGLEGGDYNDTLTGDENDNWFFGGLGSDKIYGLGGNDRVEGGVGRDTLDGGDGIDLLSYYYSASGVTINLSTGGVSGGDAEGDIISNFEDVNGSQFADTLTGDDNDNYFIGNEGKDTLSGLGGSDKFIIYETDGSVEDIIDGGAGFDGLFFYGNSDTFKIDLSTLDVSNIEFISTYPSLEAEELTFSAQDVINMTDEYNELMIFAGHNDSFRTGDEWTYVTEGDDGQYTYQVYQSGGATIYVYNTIGEENSFLGLNSSFVEVVNNLWVQEGTDESTLDLSDTSEDLTIIANELTNGQATIYTGSGDDIVYIDDTYVYSNGTDYAYTGEGNDTIYLYYTDYVDGGEGVDTIVGLTSANLEEPTHGKLLNIENIIGTSSKDIFKGDSNANIIDGLEGNDVIHSSGGGDTLYGGEGVDTLRFESSESAVFLDMFNETASGGHAENLTFSGFENIIGSTYSDTLIGNNENNEIEGSYGNDIIYGLEGNDILNGQSGEDIIYGGLGQDSMYGGLGNDIIYAGDEFDLMSGGDGDDMFYIVTNNGDINGGLDEDTINLDNYVNSEINLAALECTNIEIFETTDSDVIEITLTVDDLLGITDDDNILQIDGNVNQTVTSTGQGWVQGADQVIDTETYHTYTASGATLLVDTDIIQDIS